MARPSTSVVSSDIRVPAALGIALSLLAGACKGSTTGTDPGESNPGASAAAAPVATGAQAGASAAPPAASAYKIGLILAGPHDDKGWNQAHHDGMKAALARMSNVTFELVDEVNPTDRPDVKGSQVAEDLISRGARLIVYSAGEHEDDALETARKHPEVTVIHVSGDAAWREGKDHEPQPNLGNIMGRIEVGKHISGCAAAIGTETGKIGVLGPRASDEARRLVTAAFLGARYCWQKYRKKKPEELTFKVIWVGLRPSVPGAPSIPPRWPTASTAAATTCS
ncbi:BMP family lipoprotein [Sorangium cellulosum]|uniref:BMP family lipoprotein n=1 Tax=Sorangium cellulosum TaxID=56 RepID=UPI001F5C538D|nr:BMP family ABC transporter substrate-binding protein [Sorangium cellulosum]